MQIFETVNWLFNKVMYSFDFINYNKLHKITCYIQQSRYFQVLCDFMEFSRVDEWKSDIQIHLKLYTEQSSGFEEAHYRQVRVSWWYQQRRWSKGRKASKFLRNYRNIQQMRKKKANYTCPYSMLTKSNDKVRTYTVSGISQKLSNTYIFCDKRTLALRAKVSPFIKKSDKF